MNIGKLDEVVSPPASSVKKHSVMAGDDALSVIGLSINTLWLIVPVLTGRKTTGARSNTTLSDRSLSLALPVPSATSVPSTSISNVPSPALLTVTPGSMTSSPPGLTRTFSNSRYLDMSA